MFLLPFSTPCNKELAERHQNLRIQCTNHTWRCVRHSSIGAKGYYNSEVSSFRPRSLLLAVTCWASFLYFQYGQFCGVLVQQLIDTSFKYLTFNLTLKKAECFQFAARNSSPLSAFCFKYLFEKKSFYFPNDFLFQVGLSLCLFYRVSGKVLCFRKKKKRSKVVYKDIISFSCRVVLDLHAVCLSSLHPAQQKAFFIHLHCWKRHCELERRPIKETHYIQRTVGHCAPGMWLAKITHYVILLPGPASSRARQR